MKHKYDNQEIGELVLALLHLIQHEHYRAWKGFFWSALAHLHERNRMAEPNSQEKSVIFTEEGLAQSTASFKSISTWSWQQQLKRKRLKRI